MLTVSRINIAAGVSLHSFHGLAFLGLASALFFAGGLGGQRKANARIRNLPILLLFAIAIVAEACGGQSSMVAPPPLQPTVGTYSFTVTATALGESKPPITLSLVVK
jgi:hypothetical protein